MATKEHKERKELLAERGCVRSTSRSTYDIPGAVLIRTCCGWVCDQSRAPLDCGGRAQRRHRFSTGDRASKAAWRFASRRSPKKFVRGYVALCFLRFLVILAVLALPSVVLYAEDLTTLDGKTFTNITDIAKYPKLVVFAYNSNRTSVAVSNLPEEFRTKYGITIITNEPATSATQTQAISTDLFLWQNRENDLSESDAQIGEASTTSRTHKSWLISLRGIEVRLTSYVEDNSTYKNISESSMYFNIGQEGFINQVFDKFIEWDDVAKKNNTEPFEKEIGRCPDTSGRSSSGWHDYSFHWYGDRSCLFDSSPSGVIYKDDVIQFQQLLKRLPSIKEKLAEKIRNQKAQQSLFK